ncbi:MAG: RDD family protein [Chloroflexi bacterium]|nr:MAG: RDD family protein [Chloroflexota bacterium]
MELSVTSSPEPTQQFTGKRFGARAGAYLIDLAVIWIATIAISLVIGIILGFVFALMGRALVFTEQRFRVLDFLIGLIMSTLYFTSFEWLYGATPGKLALRMRVVMEDGRPCTFGAAFIRALLRYIDGLFFGIPAYMSMKEPLLQRIGDKAARTIVADTRHPSIQPARAWWWFVVALSAYLGMEIVAALIQTITMIR